MFGRVFPSSRCPVLADCPTVVFLCPAAQTIVQPLSSNSNRSNCCSATLQPLSGHSNRSSTVIWPFRTLFSRSSLCPAIPTNSVAFRPLSVLCIRLCLFVDLSLSTLSDCLRSSWSSSPVISVVRHEWMYFRLSGCRPDHLRSDHRYCCRFLRQSGCRYDCFFFSLSWPFPTHCGHHFLHITDLICHTS